MKPKKYLFAYHVKSEQKDSEFSILSLSENDARERILERIIDIEMTDEDDIVLGNLISTSEIENTYYECEGCSS